LILLVIDMRFCSCVDVAMRCTFASSSAVAAQSNIAHSY